MNFTTRPTALAFNLTDSMAVRFIQKSGNKHGLILRFGGKIDPRELEKVLAIEQI